MFGYFLHSKMAGMDAAGQPDFSARTTSTKADKTNEINKNNSTGSKSTSTKKRGKSRA